MKKQLLFIIGVLIYTSMHSQSELKVFQDFMTTTGTQNFFYKNVVKTDGSGNIFVAGATMNGSGNYDILVAKYNSSGVLLWIHQIDGAAHNHDFATALQIDNSGNIFITGAITNDTTSFLADLIIVKYNSSGTEQWRNTYDGAGNYDCGTDILASSGAPIVIGSSYNSSGNLDFVTISYNSSGVQQWATRYDNSGMNDVPVQIQKFGSSIYVSGGVQTGTTSYNWAAVEYNTSGVQQSVKVGTGGSTTIEEVHAMATDASGNIYLAGTTSTLTHGYDFDVIKLDSNLVIQWEHNYDGAHYNDVANGIKVNSSGDVYVTGYTKASTGLSDYLTLKYNSSGSLIWAQTYDDALNGNDEANAMTIDNSGNIYVTGTAKTETNGLDYYTMKYNSSGTTIWGISFDGNKHLDDQATGIAIDTVGNIIVTGESETSTGVYEYATVRYVEKNIITPTDFLGESAADNFLYYENKGQLVNSDLDPIPDVHFYSNNTNPQYFFKNNSASMVFSHIDNNTTTYDTLDRVDLSFTSCNQGAKVYPLEPNSGGFLNYFLAQCPDGLTKIYGNQKLVIPDLYYHIDLMYTSNQQGFKYYFIVKPGGNPDNIKLQFTGASSTAVSSHVLTINSSIGGAAFARPFMYQVNSSNDTINGSGVYADWHSNGSNNYDIPTSSYDSTKTMIIRVDQGNALIPLHINNPEWYMYFGGNGYDEGTGVTVDTDGNPYFVGYTSSNNFPTTNGSHPLFSGLFDGYISKFGSANGASSSVVIHADESQWITYYGGTDDDRVLGVSTSGNGTTGNVFLTGYTASTDFPLIPASSMYNQSDNAGGKDAFIISLDNLTGGGSSAISKWATYFGGRNDEIGTTIKNDGAGNFYIGGSTSTVSYTSDVCAVPTDANFPKCNTASTFNNANAFGGGNSDGFIAKFSNAGQLTWSSFYGGNGDDTVKALSVDVNNNLYLAGKTGSTSGFPTTPLTGTNVYNQSTFGGGTYDAFIGKFNSSGSEVWCSYYGGSGDDDGRAIIVDTGKKIYLAGETSSTTPADSVSFGLVPTTGQFPLAHPSGATFQGSSTFHGVYGGGGSDGFFAQFDSTAVLHWSTYYGGNGQDVVKALALDYTNRLFFVGRTTSTSPATNLVADLSLYFPWYYDQNTLLGTSTSDGIIGHFETSLARTWGSYIGANGNDTHNSIAVYGNASNNLFWYSTGATTSTNIQTMSFSGASDPVECCPHAYSQNSNAGSTDAFLARFSNTGMYMVGVEEINNTGALEALVYPNPASYNITLKLTLKNNENIKLEMYDISGRLVFQENEGKQQGEFLKMIDLSNFNNGMYVLKIMTDTKMVSKKIIKHE